MSVIIQLHEYKLRCQAQQGRVLLQMEPIKLENDGKTRYLYQTSYQDSNLPDMIKFLFNESIQDWFKYIDFHQQNCFQLNLQMITKDQTSEPNVNVQYTEMPFVFKIKVMQGMKEPKFKLFGQKVLFSKELKLQKLLESKQNEIVQLKNILKQKDSEIQTLKNKVSQMNKQNEELREQNSRLIQQQLPRKKIHYSADPQQGSMSEQNHGCINVGNEDSIKSKKIQKQNEQPNSSKIDNLSVQNQPSQSYPKFDDSFQQNDISDSKNHQILQIKTTYLTVNHSQKLFNRPSHNEPIEGQISNSPLNDEPKPMISNSVSLCFQNGKRQIEQERKDSNFVQNVNNGTNNKPNNVSESNGLTYSFANQAQQTPQHQHSSHPQVIALNGQILSDEKIRMIKEFAGNKCILDVGYDETGKKKVGFCCMFCEKVFKEQEFLSKHFFSRHSEINNDTTYEYLTSVWNNYKKRREQKMASIEANQAAERRARMRQQGLPSS